MTTNNGVNTDFDWTNEAVTELKRLRHLCYSASEIAKELAGNFGHGPTRASVCGKLWRLKSSLSNVEVQIRKPQAEHIRRADPVVIPKPRLKQRARIIKHEVMIVSEPEHEPIAMPLCDQEIPIAQRRQILELKNHHCHWPCGDPGTPGFFFCGHPNADVGGRKPYCASHMERARNHHPRDNRGSDARRAADIKWAKSARLLPGNPLDRLDSIGDAA